MPNPLAEQARWHLSRETGAIIRAPRGGWAAPTRLRSELALSATKGQARGRPYTVALVYPNTYFVGMSSLAVHTIYHLLNARDDVACERAFSPDAGVGAARRWHRIASCDTRRLKTCATRRPFATDPGLPLVTIESQATLDRFDVIAFSLSFEMDYLNAVDALRRARLPLFARDRAPLRGAGYPLVIAGGVCAGFNPEPLADIVDAFVIGEAEAVLDPLLQALREAQDRRDALDRLRAIPGIYVPTRGPAAPFDKLTACPVGAQHAAPVHEGAAPGCDSETPASIPRLRIADLDRWPTHTRILTPDTEFSDMFLIEISRGCAHACNFCVTAPCYRPYRYRSIEHILEVAAQGLQYRPTIGLVAAAVSDHPHLDRLVRGLRDMKARISLSSIRADGASAAVLEALGESGARSITFAPEAGTERLRRTLRKDISDEQYLAAARAAAASGMRRLRLYFMLGLPGETEADVAAIPRLAHLIKREARLAHVTVSVSAFVPKPHTAFERETMAPTGYLAAQMKMLRSALHAAPGVTMAAESPKWAFVQAALARGDRRLGPVIARACEAGGTLAAWRQAFAAEKLDPAYFASRPREPDEPLPWAHIG